MASLTLVKVCIPHTKHDAFDYLPNEEPLFPGQRVLVPLGKQTRLGVIVGLTETEAGSRDITLKAITRVLDKTPLLDKTLLELSQWISRYYQTPLSEVIPLALPKKLRLGKEASMSLIEYYHLKDSLASLTENLDKRAKKQLALLAYLSEQPEGRSKQQLRQAGFSKASLDALIKNELIYCRKQLDLSSYLGQGQAAPLPLNDDQAQALAAIKEKFGQYHCFLLQGVTGSGKTEVYLQLIAEVLKKDQQVLLLVPEIGLTPQLQQRLSARFKVPMALIHSNLNETERHNAWLAAQAKVVKLIIGTRAAVFTPLPDLGLIIIDEEHDTSLKQMEGVRYFARDVALMRAFQTKIPIVLGSATPSLESLQNCYLKKYTKLPLHQKALNSAPLQYQVIDLRNQHLQEGLASQSIQAIEDHLVQGNQVLVFINRRGFAPILICHACGFMADCKACDSHLTFHSSHRRLICHHCGQNVPLPKACPQCHGRELIPVGTGTQRIYDFLKKTFPSYSMQRIDRDEVRKKNELNIQLERIRQEGVQLIVGTQMLAKGHHFPKLTLVVVVDADYGFHSQDFRALEQLGQLLTQVAGRAGRAEHSGQVLIQTHFPQHPLLNALIRQGYDPFAQQLLLARHEAKLPPYAYLAVIRGESLKPVQVETILKQMKQFLATFALEVLGPAPAPLSRKANYYRMQLLVKASNRKYLQTALAAFRAWVSQNKLDKGLIWSIDVDPQILA